MTFDEYKNEFYTILKRAINFAEKARREGLLALDKAIDSERADNRDIFEYGMRFIIDGTDRELVDKILSNIVDQEKDEFSKALKNIQKEAVLSIQNGDNPRILMAILNSYTDISLSDPEFKKVLDYL